MDPATGSIPYPGPRPFQKDERESFFGRDRETDDVVDLVLAYRVVVLYAQSGAGKTSLVNAGVAPRLGPEGIRLLAVARVCGEIPAEINPSSIRNIFAFHTLANSLAATGEREAARAAGTLAAVTLAEGLAKIRSAAGPVPEGSQDQATRPSLLILDQFEELFRTHPELWYQRRPFFEQLGEALRRDTSLRALLVVREDYLAEIDPYASAMPDGLRIRYHLERLREQPALDAIVKPASLRGYAFESKVAESLVADLRKTQVRVRTDGKVETQTVEGEFVEPVHLQVVCQNLWLKLAAQPGAGSRTITGGMVKAYANVDQALREFYNRAVTLAARESRAPENRIRRWVEERLMTPAGTRGLVAEGELSTEGLTNQAVKVLERERIIRAEPRAGAVWYELTHDRFIAPIRTANREVRETREKRRRWAIGSAIGALVLTFGVIEVSHLTERRASIGVEEADARVFQELGMELAVKGDPSVAITGYERALATYERLGSTNEQARVLLELSVLRFQLGEDQRAREALTRAIAIYDPSADWHSAKEMFETAGLFHGVGKLFYRRGDSQHAIDAYARAIETYTSLSEHLRSPPEAFPGGDEFAALRLAASVLLDMSLAHARLGRYDGAREDLLRSRELWSTQPVGDAAPLAVAIDHFEVTVEEAPQTTQAYRNLAELHLWRHEPWPAVETIDRGIRVARERLDPILGHLQLTRRDILKTVGPSLAASVRLRSYVCSHNNHVIVASEKQSAAAAELERLRMDYPLAEMGGPYRGWVPIIGDFFLTCDEAKVVLQRVQQRHGTDPFVASWYGGCPVCPDLPRRFGEK